MEIKYGLYRGKLLEDYTKDELCEMYCKAQEELKLAREIIYNLELIK